MYVDGKRKGKNENYAKLIPFREWGWGGGWYLENQGMTHFERLFLYWLIFFK